MKKIYPIIELAAKFATIKRTTEYREGQFENDSDHSYQLALACWCANEQYGLGLNDELILKLALVHDLVEIYAGDTDAHGDKDKISSKKEKERKAFEKLKLEYFQFQGMLDAIEKYENEEGDEIHLVRILDKVIPDVNILNSNTSYYHDRNVTFGGWKKWLFSKIDYEILGPGLRLLFDEIVEEVENNFQSIFYKEF